jgi:hypothetical protein
MKFSSFFIISLFSEVFSATIQAIYKRGQPLSTLMEDVPDADQYCLNYRDVRTAIRVASCHNEGLRDCLLVVSAQCVVGLASDIILAQYTNGLSLSKSALQMGGRSIACVHQHCTFEEE